MSMDKQTSQWLPAFINGTVLARTCRCAALTLGWEGNSLCRRGLWSQVNPTCATAAEGQLEMCSVCVEPNLRTCTEIVFEYGLVYFPSVLLRWFYLLDTSLLESLCGFRTGIKGDTRAPFAPCPPFPLPPSSSSSFPLPIQVIISLLLWCIITMLWKLKKIMQKIPKLLGSAKKKLTIKTINLTLNF